MLGAPYTDVRVERFDMGIWNLPQVLPGLISIDFRPPASGPEWELTFGTIEGTEPAAEDFIREEVERVVGKPVLAIRRRANEFKRTLGDSGG